MSLKKLLSLCLVLTVICTCFIGCRNASTDFDEGTAATVQNDTKPTDSTQSDDRLDGADSSYDIEEVYADQIGRYHTALYEQWEIEQYLDNNMSSLPYYYYTNNPLDNVGYALVDLDGDGCMELVIGAILNAEEDPTVFEIWTLADGKPVMLAQGGTENRYVLQYAPEEQKWYVANEITGSIASRGVYYLKLSEGKLEVTQGIVFDAFVDEQNPWFKTSDLDWDVSNDEPIDEETAVAIQDSNRELYTAPDYISFASLQTGESQSPQKTPEEKIQERVEELSERFSVDIRIPAENELVYSHYATSAMIDRAFISSALDVLEETLSMYPEGFFAQLPYGEMETIQIELVGGFKLNEGVDTLPGEIEAFAQNWGSYYLVVVNGYQVTAEELFHEFSHIIDSRLNWEATNREDAMFSEEAWLMLQPEGFDYAMSYTEVPAELYDFLETDYFHTEYALTYPTEDRARLMEASVSDSDGLFEIGSGRREKLQFYADCIRDSFDTTGWPEVTTWEQVLQ